MADSGRERPILFSGPMAQALLAGRKTQTRRKMKLQPDDDGVVDVGTIGHTRGVAYIGNKTDGGHRTRVPCPYGAPGDRLWVRETYWGDKTTKAFRWYVHPDLINPERERDHVKLIPGIFMPKSLHRINLQITGVRVERLRDISEDDAKAEGIRRIGEQFENFPDDGRNKYSIDVGFSFNQPTAVGCYAYLWDHINGAGSWASNPWVWVLEFHVVTTVTPSRSSRPL